MEPQMRPPQVDMDAHDLIIRIPLENIPNMPMTPAGRAMALQAIRKSITDHMAQGGGGMGIPGVGGAPGGGAGPMPPTPPGTGGVTMPPPGAGAGGPPPMPSQQLMGALSRG